MLMHEGSCLFIARSNGKHLIIANDVTLTEACELMLAEAKLRSIETGNPAPIAGLAVRKVIRKPIRRQTGTGWPKS